ncbi:sec-independent protein translocase protein TatB [Lutimaribacter pacificus]|uniref:Sec-independent protein translocase protein TatB n=1 Tax=Lutimaribacter pacificus TaxID=391948 RepID=A0A1H0AW06_9RHOB|nr:Sec-independent protein translocase protein TatB [Lutimaribacter pacificus]SDN37243.1 sec-independent protein translocase protein TatB [Lutimaribacter pacificus]SHJ64479.1 sec-independent protein translocase protein TatB [Lutimaribacter pacificus]
MFDLGWTELLLIGIVALIVVGPKDLPGLFRSVGRFVGKAKGMAREFSRAMEEAADDSGMRDITKTIRSAANPMGTAMDGVKDAAKSLTDIDPDSETGKLSAERQEAKKKIEAASARKAAERKQREAQEALAKADAAEAALKTDSPAPEAKAKPAAARAAPKAKKAAPKAKPKPKAKAAADTPKDSA